jgi:predicted MFS family arabinose efflux permease
MVAVIQLAITLGALTGGLVFDVAGPAADFTGSAVILALGAVVAFFAARATSRTSQPMKGER